MVDGIYPGVIVAKGEDYFYLTSYDEAVGLLLAGIYSTSIYVYKVNDLDLAGWERVVRNLLKHVLATAPKFILKRKLDTGVYFFHITESEKLRKTTPVQLTLNIERAQRFDTYNEAEKMRKRTKGLGQWFETVRVNTKEDMHIDYRGNTYFGKKR